jgi:uncharacterized protein (TIGR02646 family)
MRNVKREGKPASLRDHAEDWNRLVHEATNNGQPIDDLIEKYRQEDVREALRRMYSDDDGCYCCYCEAQIDEVACDHIEHRKPKAMFPEYAFDWDNLHLACPKCNTNKRAKWDDQNPILDAVIDPIQDHLAYRKSVNGVYRETLSWRGITTVEHADLDRPSLRRGRQKVWDHVEHEIGEIRSLGEDPGRYTRMKILRDLCSGKYGSLIRWLLNRSFDGDPVWRGLCCG